MHRSFYWRIAISFVVLVVAVLIIQVGMFGLIVARSLDDARRLYVVLDSGELLSNRQAPPDAATRATVADMLQRTPRDAFPTTPMYLDGQRRGTIVFAPGPARPVRQSLVLLAIPGTIVLAIATALAALVIFRPARRRLRDLESAAARLGGGDLTARAPVQGGDEIAHVAAAFNRMAQELAAREESLRASDRVRAQMLADVSHELKTPLTAMRGYVEALRMAGESMPADKRERYCATLERETLRLDRIVKDLLELGRLDDHAMRLELRIFAIDRVFERVVARHEVEASARRITFSVAVDRDADQVLGDPYRIEQVVENLVANALRHTPDGGSIVLAADAAAGASRVSVVDSGDGIPAEHLAHIFDRFYKADRARSGSSGSGLGLSIAKAITERHGGKIAVESRPGRTRFTLTLPQDDQESLNL